MTYGGFGGVRDRRKDTWAVRALRGLSGVVAAGVVVLTAVVVGAAYIATNRDFPGPGRESIAAHVSATVMVIALQVFADRRHRGAAAVAAIAVLLIAGLLLWTQWWA